MYGKKRVACRVLVGRSDGKRPLGRSRRRGEGNIKMYIEEEVGAETGLIWLRRGTGGWLL
jgi:hypothetical protein